MEAAAELGLVPRISDPLAFVRQSNMLLFEHRPSSIEVDVALGYTPFEKAMVKRARKRNELTLRLATP
jgi:hypothetical protein